MRPRLLLTINWKFAVDFFASYTHCCRALTFASARLSCTTCSRTAILYLLPWTPATVLSFCGCLADVSMVTAHSDFVLNANVFVSSRLDDRNTVTGIGLETESLGDWRRLAGCRGRKQSIEGLADASLFTGSRPSRGRATVQGCWNKVTSWTTVYNIYTAETSHNDILSSIFWATKISVETVNDSIWVSRLMNSMKPVAWSRLQSATTSPRLCSKPIKFTVVSVMIFLLQISCWL